MARKLKKIPYYLMVTLLASGASLITGLLAFGGMYALMPIIWLPVAAFVLSVGYEGEIYLQNIKGALRKLFKPEALRQKFAADYLLEHMPAEDELATEDCPQFFRDYAYKRSLLHAFEYNHVKKRHRLLNKASRARKKQIEKQLRDMDKWFASVLLSPPDEIQTPFEKELRAWLVNHDQEIWQNKYYKAKQGYLWTKVGSFIAALCMGLGTTYLLYEIFTLLPFFAAIPLLFSPAIILPLAIIAGTAYGLLTYNALTDMIRNQTLQKWYRELRESWKQGFTLKNIFMTTMAVLLFTITLGLTICTAGTWWTVVKQANPIIRIGSKTLTWIVQGIMAAVIGISSFIFNIENTLETLALITNINLGRLFTKSYEAIHNSIQHLLAVETGWQLVNPFRLLLKFTITPLRILLFFGHLISMGVTSDRVPGIPEILSALLGIISEGFEDAHYFFGHGDHDEQHDIKTILKEQLDDNGHSHENDIPTRFLKLLFYPLYCLAALWDTAFCRRDEKGERTLGFFEALEKQQGIESFELPEDAQQPPSDSWQRQHMLYCIERQKEKLPSKGIGQEKRTELSHFQEDILTLNLKDPKSVEARFQEEQDKPIYNKHRLLSLGQPTHTYEVLSHLRERTYSPTSVAELDEEELEPTPENENLDPVDEAEENPSSLQESFFTPYLRLIQNVMTYPVHAALLDPQFLNVAQLQNKFSFVLEQLGLGTPVEDQSKVQLPLDKPVDKEDIENKTQNNSNHCAVNGCITCLSTQPNTLFCKPRKKNIRKKPMETIPENPSLSSKA